VIGVPAEVQYLHCDLAAGAVHGVRDDSMARGRRAIVQTGAARHRSARIVRRDAAAHDQTGAAARALGVERRHSLETALDLLETEVHGTHDDPVRQPRAGEIERLQQLQQLQGHQRTSNSPAAPMPPPTHIVTTTYLTPRRFPASNA
jgi:hypothetical protein